MSKVKVRYVGNKHKKEFHRLHSVKPQCNLDSIINRVEFARGRDAIKAGYDACAHCQAYWKSRENT